MALITVKAGDVATIVTRFEMDTRPKPKPILTSPLRLVRWKTPDPKKYRILFKRVGEHWLWYSRLSLSEPELNAIIQDPNIEIYAVADPKGIEVGLLELDFRTPGCCTIAFLGLVPQLTGQGLGQWLMSQALASAWRKDIAKIIIDTSCIDDPRALSLYLKVGFVPVQRIIDIFPDPRLTGLLPHSVAPHIPILK